MNTSIYAALVELVDAATSDRELELIAAAATAVAAPQLAADLRDVRDRARAAVRPKTLNDDEIAVQSVLDLGLAELITHSTTDEQINAFVIAAEAGSGGPLPGLQAELIQLRDAEAAEHRSRIDFTRIDPDDPFAPTALRREDTGRVFVGGAFGDPVSVQVSASVNSGAGPRIANVGETEDFVEPGESGCRFAYRG